jgi:hypothetical protein
MRGTPTRTLLWSLSAAVGAAGVAGGGRGGNSSASCLPGCAGGCQGSHRGLARRTDTLKRVPAATQAHTGAWPSVGAGGASSIGLGRALQDKRGTQHMMHGVFMTAHCPWGWRVSALRGRQ